MDFRPLDIPETTPDFRSGFLGLTGTFIHAQRLIEEQRHPDEEDELRQRRDLCLERMSFSFIHALRGTRSSEEALPLFHWVDHCFPHSPDKTSPISRWKNIFLAHSFLSLLGIGKPSSLLTEIQGETAAGTRKLF